MRPDDSLPALECLCASLRRAARAMTQVYEAELEPEGLTSPQLTLLHVLAKKGALRQGEIGEFLALDSTTLTRTLRPLESQGWIRARAGRDRRERHWELTREGRRKWKKALPAWHRAQAMARQQLGPDTVDGLLASLARVAGAGRARAGAKARRGA